MNRTIRHLQKQPRPGAIARIASWALCAQRQNANSCFGHPERFALDTGYAPAAPAIREKTAM